MPGDVRARRRPKRDLGGFERPYAPGWFDRLTDWIDRLPGSNAICCLGLGLAQLLYLSLLLWVEGKVPVGHFEWARVFVVVVAPYLLWFRFYLDRVASASLEAFRPALAVGDGEFSRLRYELTTLPAATTWLVTAVSVALSLANFLLVPERIVQQFAPSRAMAFVQLGPIAFFTTAVVAVSIFQSIHQLRMVGRIHERAGTINLLRTGPLYAFSALTARTGISFLLLTYYVAAIRPDLVASSPGLRALLTAMVPSAIACFLVPLYGMHLRIAAEKGRVLAESATRFQAVIARLHERVDQGILTDADKLNDQIAALTSERDTLSRISTWPWDPATLTAFVSALLLPILLWAVQRVLERTGF